MTAVAEFSSVEFSSVEFNTGDDDGSTTGHTGGIKRVRRN